MTWPQTRAQGNRWADRTAMPCPRLASILLWASCVRWRPCACACAQVVMCSGVMSDGSLRIVRNGIGMIEQASVELPGIKGMWALRASAMDAFDKYLVLSFVGETRILAINEDDELDEAELAGFNSQSQVCLHRLLRSCTVLYVLGLN